MRYFAFCLSVISLFGGHAAAEMTDSRGIRDTICESMTASQERLDGIPKGLLTAISLAETGRWDEMNRESFAWPWTVTAKGEGRYFDSKEDALHAVAQLQAEGVRNIDVGCMQINLLYHGEEFASVAHAIDPATNIAYAAEFLSRIHDSGETWTDAAARYHSSTPEFADRYRDKVVKLWKRTKGTDFAALEGNTVSAASDNPAEETDDRTDESSAGGSTVKPVVTPIDWERTARLNAHFAEARSVSAGDGDTGRQALIRNVAQTRAITGTTRGGRPPAGGLSFAAKRQQQLAEWRAWAKARKSSNR